MHYEQDTFPAVLHNILDLFSERIKGSKDSGHKDTNLHEAQSNLLPPIHLGRLVPRKMLRSERRHSLVRGTELLTGSQAVGHLWLFTHRPAGVLHVLYFGK